MLGELITVSSDLPDLLIDAGRGDTVRHIFYTPKQEASSIMHKGLAIAKVSRPAHCF